ncbi:MAG: tetratricopeptide repeat protein [Flavobacteriales bacterium]|nr:tetratricopeptide repeat protein [Flavobacteriales bacterium]MCB9179146.1 tetratricopeptide repeat protein [Flavobacteriales bacterium]
MTTDRLAQLRAMFAEDPTDLFLRYAIALELKSAGSMKEAAADLTELLLDAPDHVPSYYQLALILADLGRLDEAMTTCERGAERAQAAGDRKALAEIKELLATLHDEG